MPERPSVLPGSAVSPEFRLLGNRFLQRNQRTETAGVIEKRRLMIGGHRGDGADVKRMVATLMRGRERGSDVGRRANDRRRAMRIAKRHLQAGDRLAGKVYRQLLLAGGKDIHGERAGLLDVLVHMSTVRDRHDAQRRLKRS